MKINPFAGSNPMSWFDAAKVSGVLTATAFFVTFLVPYTYGVIEGEFDKFCFEAARFIGTLFFTNFVSLAGLAQLTKSKEANIQERKAETE